MKFLDFFQPHFRLIYIFLISLFLSALTSRSLLVGINALAFSIFFLLLRHHCLSVTGYLKRWLKLNLFTLCIWLTLSWRIDQGHFHLNPQGIELAWLISLRMNAILGIIWLFLFKMNDVLLLQGIRRLPLPAKLIHLFVLTLRYIAVLGEVHRKMDIAMKARGYQAKCNRRTLFVTAQRVALLLIHALIKAERSEMALKARGFRLHDGENEIKSDSL
ncbi:energy-coupling factor transporter transmembrane component T family protein [Caviibacterium pharyngocola]|uniref:ABC transporter permease n=1 Tax=Caviibacterium pharyngocola TaxID=28159 RepID=A0A2M8RW39_9PAST|nr:energy-coupling factor transporter transmembrane component T [Caviibacterium pharyngocola]PJG83099.1 ABC transporter permease [Caviibacterium pharyngocola]